MTWILIVTIVFGYSASTSGTQGSHSFVVPGFASQAACQAAYRVVRPAEIAAARGHSISFDIAGACVSTGH